MKTYEEWYNSGILYDEYVKAGDEVDEKIYWYFAETVPPRESGEHWFLLGEAVDSVEYEDGNRYLLYDLYVQKGGRYFFIGPVRVKDIVYLTNVDGPCKKYNREFITALINGWDIDISTMNHNGPKFTKDTTHLWKIHDGWQCADLLDGNYQNHRPYENVVKAMETESNGKH